MQAGGTVPGPPPLIVSSSWPLSPERSDTTPSALKRQTRTHSLPDRFRKESKKTKSTRRIDVKRPRHPAPPPPPPPPPSPPPQPRPPPPPPNCLSQCSHKARERAVGRGGPREAQHLRIRASHLVTEAWGSHGFRCTYLERCRLTDFGLAKMGLSGGLRFSLRSWCVLGRRFCSGATSGRNSRDSLDIDNVRHTRVLATRGSGGKPGMNRTERKEFV